MLNDKMKLEELNMLLAVMYSFRSTCIQNHIGIVITDKKGNNLITSYNGVPTEEVHCTKKTCYKNNEAQKCNNISAEERAISQARENGISLKDTNVFITRFPSKKGITLFIKEGVSKVFYGRNMVDEAELKILHEAGIETEFLNASILARNLKKYLNNEFPRAVDAKRILNLKNDLEAIQNFEIDEDTIVAAVGTANKMKLGTVYEALAEYYTEKKILVIGASVPSNVSDLPLSDEETEKGALNRKTNIKSALEEHSINANLYIGIEGGFSKNYIIDGVNIFSAINIEEKSGNVSFCKTESTLMPVQAFEMMRKGKDINEKIGEMLGIEEFNQSSGVIGYLTNCIYDRSTDDIRGIVKALTQIDHNSEFKQLSVWCKSHKE